MNALATLRDLFARVPWIKEFRVAQETDLQFTVHCVTDGNCCLDDLHALLNEGVPSLAALVEPRIVPELSPTGAGPDGDPEDGVPAIRDAAVLPGLAELPRTLPETLRRAARNGQADAIVHLAPDGGEKHQSFGDLLAEAEGVCGGLLRYGLKAGDSDSVARRQHGGAAGFLGMLACGNPAGDCADSADVQRGEPQTGTALSRVDAARRAAAHHQHRID